MFQVQRHHLALYIHWPFCKSKCPYCDFNSHVLPIEDLAAWQRAYITDIKRSAALLASPDYALPDTSSRQVSSIFFGGGTPSLMPPSLVAALLSEIATHWPLAPDCEITLEANPTSSEAATFQGFQRAGINRLSLGVQALKAADLRFLGREHSVDEAIAAVKRARQIFPRHSLDLITARPEQTPTEWREELNQALDLTDGHLSVYQLTYEPETLFGEKLARGKIAILETDRADDLYHLTQGILDQAGLPAYEISNHARPGDESRHNLTYWQGGDYLGLGPGAHGRLTRHEGTQIATTQTKAPKIWLQQRQNPDLPAFPADSYTLMTLAQRRDERLLMGLRLTQGMTASDLGSCVGPDWFARLSNAPRIQALALEGLLVFSPKGISATRKGRALLNSLILELSRAFS